MSKKTKDIKNYLSTIGRTEHLHVFVGYTDEQINKSSDTASIKIWQDMLFSKRVSRGDVVGVIPNYTWTYGNVYVAWKSGIQNEGAYYAWNRQNGNVYLCVQNNPDCREDLGGKNASTYIPTHAFGIQSYPDGYSWLPLYRITSEYLRFVKNDWIPVISFEDFDLYTGSTEYQNNSAFCGVTDVNTVGSCALYAKDFIRLPKDSVSFTDITKGSLVSTSDVSCQVCHALFKDHPLYQAVFYPNKNPQSTYQIENKIETIGKLISQNNLPGSSAFYALYEIATNGLSDGAIVSAFLNLSGFDTSDLFVTVENPEIAITSFSGSGALLRFKTYKTLQGKNVINGIQLITNGSGYKDFSLDISSSIFEVPAVKDLILANITINYDIIDGLNIDPYDVLNCKNIQIDTRVDVTDITLNNLLVSDEINMYSLVSNPLEETGSGNYIISGSDLSKYTSNVKTGYTTLAVTRVGDTVTKTRTPVKGNSAYKDSSGNIVSRPKILKSFSAVSGFSPTAVQSIITINNLEYSNITKASTIEDSEGFIFNVNSIINKPSLKQYSGKILNTVKTDKNLKLSSSSGELSKVIRINMIRGI